MKISLTVIALATILFSQNGIAQNVGIGIAPPLTKLHIFNGASGATPFPSTALAVESNTNTYLNLLSPAANETALLFGMPGLPSRSANGVIMYNNPGTPNGFQFRTNGNLTRMIIDNAGNVGIGTVAPASKLEITHNGASTYGTALLINQDLIGNADGPRIQFKKTMTIPKSWTTGILNGVNVGTFGISEDGGTDGFGTPRFTINQGGFVGIGTSSPNAPLGFPASLGKKITLYPGATGDVGLAVAGNRLQIYSDNPNADVAIGYDAAGTFNEKFAFKPNGALAINGNAGTAGQVLQSNGAGSAATWMSPGTVHSVGESYGGGIVFYVYENGQHGLIAATADQGPPIQWYNGSYTNTIAIRDGIGANSYNTEHIITNQGVGVYAAMICAKYTGGGYGDWYLPSKYELNLLNLQKTLVGGFVNALYWSSTENDNTFAWEQSFTDGIQYTEFKQFAHYVRAIRAF